MTECIIFRSCKRDFTYIYLRKGLELEDLPAELRSLLGEVEHVMELDLASCKRLEQEDIETVRLHVEDPGYYLQLPPTEDPSGWLDLKPRSP